MDEADADAEASVLAEAEAAAAAAAAMSGPSTLEADLDDPRRPWATRCTRT